MKKILLILLAIVFLIFVTGCSVDTQNDSIKDVSQNLEKYYENNQTLKIKGKLGNSMEIDYYLKDDEGYYVLINQNSCIGINRIPKENEVYTFEGKLRKNSHYYYRLFCGDTIDSSGVYK